MSDTPIVIVGAGLAGLSAAVRLHAAGRPVLVLDPAPPGGKARTIEPIPGWRVEWGPHSFTARADALHTLIGELGLAEKVVKLGDAAKARFLVRGGRLRKAPGGAFSLGEWFALVRGLLRRVPDVPGESVRAFVARRFGEALADGPVDAMMTGIWASDPADIEMDAAFPTIVRLVRERGTLFGALRAMPRSPRKAGTYGLAEGMGVVAEAARARLGPERVREARAERISRADGGFVVDTTGGSVFAERVIVATEADAARALLRDVAPDAVAPLSEIRYAPLAVAHWLTPDAAFPRGFGFLAAHAENRPVLGTIFVSDLYPDRVPEGHRSFATMIGGARRPDDARIDAQEARRRVEAEHRALTGRTVTFAGFHLVHHPRAVAPPRPGHAARIAAIRAALPRGITIAASWCGAGAMDDAVAAGFGAAAEPEG